MRPILLFAIGNRARGDDALGPLLGDRLAALDAPDLECLEVHQLQIEHALELTGRALVLFVDAALADADGAPWRLTAATPSRDAPAVSHALTPDELLAVHARIEEPPAPPCLVLAVTGEQFELGADLSAPGRRNLAAAEAMLREIVLQPHVAIGRDLGHARELCAGWENRWDASAHSSPASPGRTVPTSPSS